MALCLTKNVPRPNYNTTIGVPVKVITNHFKIKSLPSVTIQQWAVSFTTERPPPTSKAALMRRNNHIWSMPEVQTEFGNNIVIYNGGGIAYTCQPMPFESLDKTLDSSNKTKISMVKTTTINPETLQQMLNKKYAFDENVAQVIMFLDALISHTPRQTFATVFGTSQFFKSSKEPQSVHDKNVFDLGDNVQLWRGIFQSARPGPGYMTINVDVAHTAFYKPHITVIDLLVGNLHLPGPPALAKLKEDHRRKRDALKLLQGLGVYTNHTARRDKSVRPDKIYGIIWKQTALTYKFEKDGKMVSVSQHMKAAYNITLQYPSLPLIEISGGKNVLPMELCMVASGQRFPNVLLTGQQTAEIVKQAARPPADRLASIRDNIKSLNWMEDPAFKAFGLQASPEAIEASARILDSPGISYGASSLIKPKDGRWVTTGKKLFKGAVVSSWGILKLSHPRDDTTQFEREIVNSGTRYGIQFAVKEPHVEAANPNGHIEEILRKFYNNTGNKFKKRPQILFIIIPKGDLYGVVKAVCDTKLGVPSQCIAGANLRKANGQYCDNVWLKANAKLGGTNTRLGKTAFTGGPTLLLGADVSHPPAGALAGGSPSIASLVSNIDLEGVRFIGQASAQTARQEVVQDLQRMVFNAIQSYDSKSTPKSTLKTIIYYRDGVGENQFDAIREKELAAIRKACIDQNVPRIKITVVICQKRHHTRFFSKVGIANVKPGTVVDGDVTHPIDHDFFLVPHHSFKGTARPTHYQVIYDDNQFNAGNIQKLTHDMCYTFARSTTAVSLVPVAYYAHLVGNRVKAYCGGGSDTDSNAAEAVADPRGLLPMLHPDLRPCMWFI